MSFFLVFLYNLDLLYVIKELYVLNSDSVTRNEFVNLLKLFKNLTATCAIISSQDEKKLSSISGKFCLENVFGSLNSEIVGV